MWNPLNDAIEALGGSPDDRHAQTFSLIHLLNMFYISEVVFYYACLGSDNPVVTIVREFWEKRVEKEIADGSRLAKAPLLPKIGLFTPSNLHFNSL